ncbi:MAG: bifunctional tetrahydrofolate synthase/dihydrofolate synthase [Pseudohongiellaceae bacterium]|nr:bifunctional tetrahydrofolate synthase/dihydrofolate synthase [Pseudohongiellaceae bacterium]
MNLNQWLKTIESLHPSEIDLGLERLRTVSARMGLSKPAPLVITVAGTNGKGSTVAMLEAIYLAAGYSVGTYTSPHLFVYNERIRINGQMVSDQSLCDCFQYINDKRQQVSLTYFEFGTLAGLKLIEDAGVDIAILEVGLGGRLDGVNIVDPDIAVITSVGLDHQDWLGDTREAIGLEKAGIFRPGIKAVCGDPEPPHSVLLHAHELGAHLAIQGQTFGFAWDGKQWEWNSLTDGCLPTSLQELPTPALDLINASTTLQAIHYAGKPVTEEAIRTTLSMVSVPGRFQRLQDKGGKNIILDVAHNPQAGELLSQKLSDLREFGDLTGQVRVVLAMMSDKDHIGFYNALESNGDFWYIAAFPQPRCEQAPVLMEKLQQAGAKTIGPFNNIADALCQACEDAAQNDIILVTGSFMTVADAMDYIA